MLFTCRRYFQKVIFSLAVMILLTPASHAATLYNKQISGDYTITADTEITIDNWLLGYELFGESAIIATAGQSIIAGPSIFVSIDIDVSNDFATYNGLRAVGAGALISLDKVYINSGRGVTTALARGIFADEGAEVYVGNGSEIYANNNGLALASGGNAKVSVGDNVTLYGTIFGSDAAVVMAKGGQVVIGNNAIISNDGYFAESSGSLHSNSHYAVFAATGNSADVGIVTIGDSATIVTGGSYNYNRALVAGVLNDNQYTYGIITVGDKATIETFGASNNTGLYSMLNGSVITIGSDSQVTTHGHTSYGAYSYLGGHINIGQGSKILTYDEKAAGLVANGSAGSADASTINTSDDVTIETRSADAYGARAYSDTDGNKAEITLGNSNTIITNGESSFGLIAQQAGSVISAGDKLNITTNEKNSYAVYARDGGTISTGDSLIISTEGANAHGLLATASNSKVDIGKNASITTSGTNANGAYATSGGAVEIGSGAYITASGYNVYGLFASGLNSSIVLKEAAKITTTGADSFAVYAYNGGKVEMYGAEITAGAGDYAIASHSSNTSTNNSVVSGDGIFKITGDIIAQAGSNGAASVDLVMRDKSLFTGATEIYGGTAEINLSLNGSSTLWDVTEASQLTSLYMSGSTVDMMNTNGDATLTMANLGASASDTGIFKMDTNIPLETADMLVITDTAQGSYLISVRNDGSQAAVGTEITNLVRAAGGQSVSFLLQNEVESGGWQYGLHYEDGSVAGGLGANDTWSLRATGNASSSGSAAINNFAGSYLMTYATMQTLIQRMGDLRDSPYGQGVWFRAHGGKFESNSKSYVRGFDMKYGGVQIGYDRRIDNEWNGRLYAGVMFDYSKGDLDYSDEGSGTVNSKALGVYGTFIANNGWYVDAVLKYQWMDNDFDVIDTAGTLVSGGEISTGGFGASIEAGKRISLGETKVKGGWYVEPQLQLSYQHHDGGYFNASNGLHIGTDSFKSLLGRIGVLVGYETGEKNFYAKVSRVKELDGDLTARANGVVIDESFGDSWWVYGLGITSRVNDRNSFYLDIERTSGGSFRQPWRVNGGWRIEF